MTINQIQVGYEQEFNLPNKKLVNLLKFNILRRELWEIIRLFLQ